MLAHLLRMMKTVRKVHSKWCGFIIYKKKGFMIPISHHVLKKKMESWFPCRGFSNCHSLTLTNLLKIGLNRQNYKIRQRLFKYFIVINWKISVGLIHRSHVLPTMVEDYLYLPQVKYQFRYSRIVVSLNGQLGVNFFSFNWQVAYTFQLNLNKYVN